MTVLAKKLRIVDEDLLEEIRSFPCIACANQKPRDALEALRDRQILPYVRRAHPHHITSRGAGGDDVSTNVIPLCFEHHREIHTQGTRHMMEKYDTIKSWFEAAKRLEEFY